MCVCACIRAYTRLRVQPPYIRVSEYPLQADILQTNLDSRNRTQASSENERLEKTFETYTISGYFVIIFSENKQ